MLSFIISHYACYRIQRRQTQTHILYVHTTQRTAVCYKRTALLRLDQPYTQVANYRRMSARSLPTLLYEGTEGALRSTCLQLCTAVQPPAAGGCCCHIAVTLVLNQLLLFKKRPEAEQRLLVSYRCDLMPGSKME